MPIIGKMIGDASDAVMLSASVIKGALGILGIVIIAGEVLIPVIRIGIQMILFSILSALSEFFEMKEFSSLMSSFQYAFSALVAMSACVGVMMIIGLSILIQKGGVV